MSKRKCDASIGRPLVLVSAEILSWHRNGVAKSRTASICIVINEIVAAGGLIGGENRRRRFTEPVSEHDDDPAIFCDESICACAERTLADGGLCAK